MVSVTENGSFFFENQITSDRELGTKFRALSKTAAPLTLVLQADGGLRHSNLVSLLLIAREAGIRETLIAVRPQLQPTVPPGAFGTRSVP